MSSSSNIDRDAKASGESVYDEQQDALRYLASCGLSRTEIARMVGVGVASVRAWEVAAKLARPRARNRLLDLAGKPAQALASNVSEQEEARGRTSESENRTRIAAMKTAGLYPLPRCADELRKLLKSSEEGNLTATELATILGVSKNTFYAYLGEENTRLMPVEVVRRFTAIRATVTGGCRNSSYLTLQHRFTCASIALFGEYHYLGLTARDGRKRDVLHTLAEATGFSERTLRRYVPPSTGGRRVPRAIVEAFENAVRCLGPLM